MINELVNVSLPQFADQPPFASDGSNGLVLPNPHSATVAECGWSPWNLDGKVIVLNHVKRRFPS